MTGGFIVFVLIVVGLLAPLIAPADPNAQNLGQALRRPDWLFGPHVLGTDAVGRDILSRLFYGARISLVIAVLVVLISGAAGFLVENGAIVHPVDGITIAGNLRQMFAAIEAVGSDVDPRSHIRTGSILVGRMTVAGAQ